MLVLKICMKVSGTSSEDIIRQGLWLFGGFFDLEEAFKYSNIQKVWWKSQVNFDNIAKDVLPVNFTKLLPLEYCQMKTVFKVQLQCIFLGMQA